MIEKGIPIPEPKKVVGYAAKIRELLDGESGDSVLIKDGERPQVNNAAHRLLGKGNYAIAREGKHLRVWKR